jgi:cold shock CspA family protein
MNIGFGMVKKYFAERGFGFVTYIFANDYNNEVFFHIKNVKRTHPDLATRLINNDFMEKIWFWYEIEETQKGKQVRFTIDPMTIAKEYAGILPLLINKIEQIWENIDLIAPEWLNQVTIDLAGSSRTNELRVEREMLQLERREENEKKRMEAEALQKLEDAKWQKSMQEQIAQHEIEDKEFRQLVEEMAPLGFTHSNQVSSYIMRNRLGDKYKNISGVLTIEKDGNTWNFNGGFPPKIYAKLCSELDLGNQGTFAQVVGFTSFNELRK